MGMGPGRNFAKSPRPPAPDRPCSRLGRAQCLNHNIWRSIVMQWGAIREFPCQFFRHCSLLLIVENGLLCHFSASVWSSSLCRLRWNRTTWLRLLITYYWTVTTSMNYLLIECTFYDLFKTLRPFKPLFVFKIKADGRVRTVNGCNKRKGTVHRGGNTIFRP